MLMTSVKNSILLILLFISGCAVVDSQDNEAKASALQAYPRSISMGESIRLTFPQNHPHNVAVRNPSGVWYSIQNTDDDVFVIPSTKYNVATELQLNTLLLEGITWINGKN